MPCEWCQLDKPIEYELVRQLLCFDCGVDAMKDGLPVSALEYDELHRVVATAGA